MIIFIESTKPMKAIRSISVTSQIKLITLTMTAFINKNNKCNKNKKSYYSLKIINNMLRNN